MSNRNSKKNQELYANFPRLFPELAPARSYPKNNQNTSLREETLCLCPPETSDTAAIGGTDDVDGGIFSIVQRLNQIKEEINQLNGSAFEKSLLSDAQHYQLLDVEMFIADFVSRASVSASVCDCGSTFYRDDLGSCYDCFFPSERGE